MDRGWRRRGRGRTDKERKHRRCPVVLQKKKATSNTPPPNALRVPSFFFSRPFFLFFLFFFNRVQRRRSTRGQMWAKGARETRQGALKEGDLERPPKSGDVASCARRGENRTQARRFTFSPSTASPDTTRASVVLCATITKECLWRGGTLFNGRPSALPMRKKQENVGKKSWYTLYTKCR